MSKRNLTICALLLWATCATAQTVTVGAHIATQHWGRSDMNDFNPGIYVQARTGPLSGASVGMYYNSERAGSVYAAYTWETKGRMLAVSVGAVTGYKGSDLTPIVLPSLRLPIGAQAVRLTYLPKANKQGASGVHISLERDL